MSSRQLRSLTMAAGHSRHRITIQVTPAMVCGQRSFADYITERFDALRDDLISECDRIAVARELHLKNELEEAHRQNEDLRRKFRIITAKLGEAALTKFDSSQLRSLSAFELSSMELSSIPLSRPLGTPMSDGSYSNKVSAAFSDATGVLDSAMSSSDRIKPMVVSLDGLIGSCSLGPSHQQSGGDSKDSNDTSQAHASKHFELWTEWGVDAADVLRSVTKADLEEHELQEDSALEQDWLCRREENQVEDDNPTIHSASVCVYTPHSTFAFSWEMFGIPVLFYDLVTIPLQVFVKPTGFVASFIGYSVLGYWSLDMFLRGFFFGYVNEHGEVVAHRKHILKNYLRNSFLFDFVMVAPDWFSMAIGAPRNVALLRTFRMMRLMRLMRMSKLKKIIRKIQDVVDTEYFNVMVNMGTNLMAIVGCCHYLACLWFAAGSRSIAGYPSWVTLNELEDAEWSYQYVISLHWAITQFTPGGSKLQPVNIPECIIAITVLIFGMVFFSLFISSLTQERMRLQALTSKMDRDNWILRRYLRQHGVSTDVTARTIRYVDACVAPLMQRVQRKDVALLEYLSRPLQLEVQAEMFYHTLLVHPFLQHLRKHSVSLSSHLFADVVVEVSLAHTDLLFEVGQVSHEMYFVSRGTMAYLQRGSNEVQHLTTGQWCCEPVLWVPWVHKGTIRAAEECYLISIDAAKLRTAVLEHKERTYVRRCAQGYLRDLNSYVDQGKPVSDTICITDNQSSEYIKAIEGEVGKPFWPPKGNWCPGQLATTDEENEEQS